MDRAARIEPQQSAATRYAFADCLPTAGCLLFALPPWLLLHYAICLLLLVFFVSPECFWGKIALVAVAWRLGLKENHHHNQHHGPTASPFPAAPHHNHHHQHHQEQFAFAFILPPLPVLSFLFLLSQPSSLRPLPTFPIIYTKTCCFLRNPPFFLLIWPFPSSSPFCGFIMVNFYWIIDFVEVRKQQRI